MPAKKMREKKHEKKTFFLNSFFRVFFFPSFDIALTIDTSWNNVEEKSDHTVQCVYLFEYIKKTVEWCEGNTNDGSLYWMLKFADYSAATTPNKYVHSVLYIMYVCDMLCICIRCCKYIRWKTPLEYYYSRKPSRAFNTRENQAHWTNVANWVESLVSGKLYIEHTHTHRTVRM